MSLQISFNHLLSKCPKELTNRIVNLKNIPQRPDHHPCGSVFNHTKIVVNRLIKYQDPILSWSALYHDIGKDETTKMNSKGILQALGHEDVSASLVEEYFDFLEGFDFHPGMVYDIVKFHMRIKVFEEMKASKRMKMAAMPSFGRLWLFRQADDMSTLTTRELKSIL